MFSPFLSDCLVSEEWSWTQRIALTGEEGDEFVREGIDHFPSDWQTYRISFQILHGGFRNVGFPGSSDSKESACNPGDPGLILGSGRSSGEGNSNPLWSSCPENPMDRGAWWAIVHGAQRVRQDWTTNTFNTCGLQTARKYKKYDRREPNYRPNTYDMKTPIIRKVRILKIKKLDIFLVVSHLHHFFSSFFLPRFPGRRKEKLTSLRASPAL